MNPYRNERQFGLLFSSIALILALWPLSHGGSPAWWWGLTAAGLGLVAFVKPLWLRPLTQAWMWLGHHLGRINTLVLLSLVFFLLITPLALLFRMMRRDPLELHHSKRNSFWHRHDQKPTPESFRNQF